MIKQTLYTLFLLALMISCKPSKKDTEIADILASEDQQEVKISGVGVTLSPLAKRKTANWLAYQLLQSKMDGYFKTTKSQALENAMDLANQIKHVSDTIAIKKLDRPDVKTRFNVLRNFALRLDDMLTIPSITDEEVMREVTNILEAYSSLNDKINTIYAIEEYENQLEITSPSALSLKVNKVAISDKKPPPIKKMRRTDKLKKSKHLKKRIPLKRIDLKKN